MIISQSTVNMKAVSLSKYQYVNRNSEEMTNLQSGQKTYNKNAFSWSYEESTTDTFSSAYDMLAKDEVDYEQSDNNYNNKGLLTDNEEVSEVQTESTQDQLSELLQELRNYMQKMRSLLDFYFRRNYSFVGNNGFSSYSVNTGNVSNIYSLGNREGNVLDLSSSGAKTYWLRKTTTEYEESENENMTFSAQGNVLTADGRSLEFDMDVTMTREYVKKTQIQSSDIVAIMTDPLVISLDSSPLEVSNQKWKFDVDADGEEDEISLLSGNTAFLAYDSNNDGKINNGKELFGARTGNGFTELSEFDEDKNGWIDENDSIYEKLSVWIKDDKGNDKLLNLKEADVGAIYTGNVKSSFSMNSENNDVNAQLKSSGIYMSETGKVRALGQLDMAKQKISYV